MLTCEVGILVKYLVSRVRSHLTLESLYFVSDV